MTETWLRRIWINILYIIGLLRRRVPYHLPYEEDWRKPSTRSRLRPFKNAHHSERCFIIGNGPSLNQTDLTRLADEITFGVNGIFYKTDEVGFVPTYYAVEDPAFMRDNLARINTYRPARYRFFPARYYHDLTDHHETAFFEYNRGFYLENSPNYGIPRFSTDAAQRLYSGMSITYINMQLAFYMGFREVFLIGVDFSYVIPPSAKIEGTLITSTEADPNHFHPDYFGAGKQWHDPQLDRVGRAFQLADNVFRWHNRQIFNATIGGELEIFQRVRYDDLF